MQSIKALLNLYKTTVTNLVNGRPQICFGTFKHAFLETTNSQAGTENEWKTGSLGPPVGSGLGICHSGSIITDYILFSVSVFSFNNQCEAETILKLGIFLCFFYFSVKMAD